MKQKNLTLLTFYKFVDISSPTEEIALMKDFLSGIGVLGRVFIGEEWISATMTGNSWQVAAIKLYLDSRACFRDMPDMDIKSTKVSDYHFDKMIVRYRREIVALDYPVTAAQVEQYRQDMSVEDFKQLLDHGDPDSFVVLDMRNNYEYLLGHFKYAVPSGTVNFREMHTLRDEYAATFGSKQVIMYCTGGIRCEKLAVLLNARWFTNFYALEWGIVKYVNSYNDGNWLGNLYTFDWRVSTDVGDSTTHTTIGECNYTGKPTDSVANCRYAPCNARLICNKSEYRRHLWFCCSECMEWAKSDLLVKPMRWDKWDYRWLRAQIEADPTQADIIHEAVSKYYNARLDGVTFRHTTSQKEDYIDCGC